MLIGTLFTMYGLVNGQIRGEESLSFFRVVAEKEYKQSPERFQVSKHSELGTVFDLYTERKPTFTVPLREIVSVTIETQQKYGPKYGIEEAIKDFKQSGSDRNANAKSSPYGFIYTANITLSPTAQKLFSEFVNKNDGKQFDCRLGTQSLSIAHIVVPPHLPPGVTSSKFLLWLGEKDKDQIKVIFSPIGDKLRWHK